MSTSNPTRRSLNTNFVGRRHAFDAIEKLWTVPPGTPRSMLLWGEWLVGKSEVLWNVGRYCPEIKVAYISTQRLGSDRDSKHVWASLAFALEEIANTVYLNEFDFLKNPYPAFVESLKQVLDEYPNHKLLLAIDQYEGFLTIPETSTILKQLEELTLKHDRLAFLLCGSHDSDRVEIGFKPTQKLWLGAFTKEETVQFVNQQPYKFDTDAMDLLHELTGGQPWLVRGLCFNAIRELNERLESKPESPKLVTVSKIEAAIATDNAYRLYFEGLWAKSERVCVEKITAQQILSELADDPDGETVEEIARYIRTSCAIVSAVLEKMMEYHPGGLIAKRREGSVEVYRVAIELFRRWIFKTQK